MPGPLAVAAPYLIPIAASFISGMFKKKAAVDPVTAAKNRAELAAMNEAKGDRSALRALINDFEFAGADGSPYMRLLLPGGGVSRGEASKSMDNFYSQADFSGKRSENLLKSLLQLNQPGNSSSAAAAGQAQEYAAGQQATGALSKTLNDLGQKGFAAWQGRDKTPEPSPAPAGTGGKFGPLFDLANMIAENAGKN